MWNVQSTDNFFYFCQMRELESSSTNCPRCAVANWNDSFRKQWTRIRTVCLLDSSNSISVGQATLVHTAWFGCCDKVIIMAIIIIKWKPVCRVVVVAKSRQINSIWVVVRRARADANSSKGASLLLLPRSRPPSPDTLCYLQNLPRLLSQQIIHFCTLHFHCTHTRTDTQLKPEFWSSLRWAERMEKKNRGNKKRETESGEAEEKTLTPAKCRRRVVSTFGALLLHTHTQTVSVGEHLQNG